MFHTSSMLEKRHLFPRHKVTTIGQFSRSMALRLLRRKEVLFVNLGNQNPLSKKCRSDTQGTVSILVLCWPVRYWVCKNEKHASENSMKIDQQYCPYARGNCWTIVLSENLFKTSFQLQKSNTSHSSPLSYSSQ